MAERIHKGNTSETLHLPDFDLHHATKLLIASFNHSQGNENMQDGLFEYLHRLRPNIRISGDFRSALQARAQPILYRLLSADERREHAGHRPVRADEVDLHLDKESRRLQAIFNSKKRPPLLTAEALLMQLACEVLERDYHWTIETLEGRPNRRRPSRVNRPSHWHDPYFSYGIEHALEGRPTEAAEYDHLYAQIGAVYRQALTTENAQRKLPAKSYQQLVQLCQRGSQVQPAVGISKQD